MISARATGRGELLGPGFDTPSLRGVWHTAPYLHDGRASTLREVLITHNPTDQHGQTSHLSEVEVYDLVAFLLSVEGEIRVGCRTSSGWSRKIHEKIASQSLPSFRRKLASSPQLLDAGSSPA